MRFSEIVLEDEDQSDSSTTSSVDANIITALDLIRNRIREENLNTEIPINIVLKFIQNTGIPGFTYHDLITANENSDAIKNLVKNITADHVTFTTDSDTAGSVTNTPDYDGSVDNPEQTVSNMAKSAMKRRQK